MTGDVQIQLMRLLHGQLPEGNARALRDRLAREPELAAAYRRLERTWAGLELPPAAPAPLGFTSRVMARLDAGSPVVPWAKAPVWVRATGVAALLAGVLLGMGVGIGWMPSETHAHTGLPPLTESYLAIVNDSTAPALPPAQGGEARQ
jgi:anti-sigma factor RsiW